MAVVSVLLRLSFLLTLHLLETDALVDAPNPFFITRQNNGDLFLQGSAETCTEERCVGLSSGTATAVSEKDKCTCQCHAHLPAFREDLSICVDDIHECLLAPFVGGSTSQQIPFVFLPLKGQIIHPSKEISFTGIQTPICAVSGAKFMTETGWVDLRNPLDNDVPFRLYRDEGRTFLQWVGESDLRNKMSGRLVLIYLMCRDLAKDDPKSGPGQTLFSPCVAFRVVGTPTKYFNNVSEVAFLPDAYASSNSGGGLSVSEYVAIGICSILLGLIYVASVFLYLHLKKRKSSKTANKPADDQSLADAEEGVIKNNPLLSMVSNFSPPENIYDSTSSDTDVGPDILQSHEERKKHKQITSAMIHPQHFNIQYDGPFGLSRLDHRGPLMEDQSSNIERLPEENVSIVETIEREERPENLRAITGTVRKKLYFNPAYFEPQLLHSPPPAALEFLCKIREVITIAKEKMETKKYTPTLIVIPEEESNYLLEPSFEFGKPVSRRSSIISLKRQNSRRKNCAGCPGCEPEEYNSLHGKLPEFPSLSACHNCSTPSTTNDSKQISIQKWLEDVPIIKNNAEQSRRGISSARSSQRSTKRVRSPTRSLPPDGRSSPARSLTPKPPSEKSSSSVKSGGGRHRKSITKPKTPPPPLPPNARKNEINNNNKQKENVYDTIPAECMNFPPPPPDMINEAMLVQNNENSIPRIPTLTKNQMKAVINELTVHRNNIANETEIKSCFRRGDLINYETDSLERSGRKGYHTPSDYAEVSSSSQPSPSLSAALPMEEEMTMRNAIINKKTGNMTISKLSMDSLHEDDHDYELMVMKKGSNNFERGFRLPELLKKHKEYSLVSEVYVNNGYNYGSTPSSIASSNCSTLEKPELRVRYDGGIEKPGKLLIEVEDCANNYIPVDDSDSFEADTLDRKPKQLKLPAENKLNNEYIDSLERPMQILLKTNGSFRKNSPPTILNDEDEPGNFNRVFGSLREIFEAKNKGLKRAGTTDISDEEGRLLTLEERHSRRQRKNIYGAVVQPDVIPPPSKNSPIYEHPKPPRKVMMHDLMKPPLPPKNGSSRSVRAKKTIPAKNSNPRDTSDDDYEVCLVQKSKKDGNILTSLIQAEDIILKKGNNDQFILHNTNNSTSYRIPFKSLQSLMSAQNTRTWKSKPEDSGYLSTDSNESRKLKKNVITLDTIGIGSETDESLGDGHSESGGESVETHSVFFGSFNRKPLSYTQFGSVDSGVMGVDDGLDSTDSEHISYTTVVPV